MNAITPMKAWKTPFLRAFFFIPANPPFLCANLLNFGELRGDDYFFMPSLTALQMMASGAVDPR